MGLCWFCEERETSPEAGIEISMRKVLAERHTLKRSEVQYQERKVIIPRCLDCQKEEATIKKYSVLTSIPAMALGIAGGVLAGKRVSTFLAVVVGLVLFLGGFMGFLALILKYPQVTKHRNKNKALKDHPEIKKWEEQGWIHSAGV